MLNKLLKFWTFKAITLLSVLYGIFLIPYVGLVPMLLMVTLGEFTWGLLPHLITIGLICDVITKRMPKKILLLPLLIYPLYYVLYYQEYQTIKSVKYQLKERNATSPIVHFNPSTHSLVSSGAHGLVIYNKIDVAYEKNINFPEGYLSYRLVSADMCKEIKLIKRDTFDFDVMSATWSYGNKKSISESLRNRKKLSQCIVRTHERPTKAIIEISIKKTDKLVNGVPISEATYIATHQNEIIGTFVKSSIKRMPKFPFLTIGCFLNSSRASWDCFINWTRKLERDMGNPINSLINLEKYTEYDFSHFQDYPENVTLINNWLNKRKNETQEDFNEWGVRKDSVYMPEIKYLGSIESYTGGIYSRKEGGPFYSFIKRNQGKVIHLDASLENGVNGNAKGFGIYGICKKNISCGRVDHWYQIIDESKEGKKISNIIQGYWKVGVTEIIKDNRDGDTRTLLHKVN